MKKIASSIFWVSIAIILLNIHVIFVASDSNVYEMFPTYYLGMGIVLIMAMFSCMNMDRVASEIGYKKYWINVLSIIQKWWYWIGFIFLFVLIYNAIYSLAQLGMDEQTISQKICIGENQDPYMGQLFTVLAALVMIGFIAPALWRRMRKMPEKML
ncbi:MAG TPA: hypothetical protein PKC87_03210 [Candidatus Absconditabacterales bacterium]|nr:hypothetical protein [Candidatus Absconditabacterales bacterium]